jgi:hypothetical protein
MAGPGMAFARFGEHRPAPRIQDSKNLPQNLGSVREVMKGVETYDPVDGFVRKRQASAVVYEELRVEVGTRMGFQAKEFPSEFQGRRADVHRDRPAVQAVQPGR